MNGTPMNGGPPAEHADAVVIGSGFGGAVAACRLAQAGLSVILLERGNAYPPDSFPRTPAQMSRAFWDPAAGLYGMFDVWHFAGCDSVVSSGLGGGSLIYANVLLRKDEHWFVQDDPLPQRRLRVVAGHAGRSGSALRRGRADARRHALPAGGRPLRRHAQDTGDAGRRGGTRPALAAAAARGQLRAVAWVRTRPRAADRQPGLRQPARAPAHHLPPVR